MYSNAFAEQTFYKSSYFHFYSGNYFFFVSKNVIKWLEHPLEIFEKQMKTFSVYFLKHASYVNVLDVLD